jgi:hypothetical protein
MARSPLAEITDNIQNTPSTFLSSIREMLTGTPADAVSNPPNVAANPSGIAGEPAPVTTPAPKAIDYSNSQNAAPTFLSLIKDMLTASPETVAKNKASLAAFHKGIGDVLGTTIGPAGGGTPPAAAAAEAPPGAGIVPAEPAEKPAKTVKDLTTSLRQLSDKDFAQFMTEHPHIGGLGYLKGASGKMKRIIDPHVAGSQDNEFKDMSNYDAEQFAKVIHGVAAAGSAAGTKEYARAIGIGNMQTRQAAQEEKAHTDYITKSEKEGIESTDADGNKRKNPIPVYIRDYKIDPKIIPPKLREGVGRLVKTREAYIDASMNLPDNKKRNFTREQIGKFWDANHSQEGL